MSNHSEAEDHASVWLLRDGDAALQLVIRVPRLEPGGKIRCKVSHSDGVREWESVHLYQPAARRPWRAQIVFPRDFDQGPPVPEATDMYRATWRWRVHGQPHKAEVDFRWPKDTTGR